MTPFAAGRKAERVTTCVSLVVGPLLMSIGDLLHPEERMSPVEQIAIVVDHASRWYTAHLLLFFGMLLYIPGFLGLTALSARLKPGLGYAARSLIMIGTAGFASIITGEMLASRLVLDGVGNAAPISLWTNLFMGPVVVAVGPALLAFFVGIGMFAIPLLRGSQRLRRPIALIVGSANRLCYFGARDQGTCSNKVTIRRDEVDARVLKALRRSCCARTCRSN